MLMARNYSEASLGFRPAQAHVCRHCLGAMVAGQQPPKAVSQLRYSEFCKAFTGHAGQRLSGG